MGTMVSQITSLTIVYSTVYLGADQRKHQNSVSLAFVNSPHKWPVTRKMFPFDDFIVISYNHGKLVKKPDTFFIHDKVIRIITEILTSFASHPIFELINRRNIANPCDVWTCRGLNEWTLWITFQTTTSTQYRLRSVTFWHGRPGIYFVCVCSGFGSFVKIFLTVTRAIILWHWSGTAVLLKHYFHNSSMQQEANLSQQTMPKLGRLIWSKGIPMVFVQLKLHMDTKMYLCIYEKAIWSGDKIVIKNMPYCSCWKYHGVPQWTDNFLPVSWHSPPPPPPPPPPPNCHFFCHLKVSYQ